MKFWMPPIQVQLGQYYQDLLQSTALLDGKISQGPYSSTTLTSSHPQKAISKQLYATLNPTRTPQPTMTFTTLLGTILQNNTPGLLESKIIEKWFSATVLLRENSSEMMPFLIELIGIFWSGIAGIFLLVGGALRVVVERRTEHALVWEVRIMVCLNLVQPQEGWKIW